MWDSREDDQEQSADTSHQLESTLQPNNNVATDEGSSEEDEVVSDR